MRDEKVLFHADVAAGFSPRWHRLENLYLLEELQRWSVYQNVVPIKDENLGRRVMKR
jgi:hypothetical protein